MRREVKSSDRSSWAIVGVVAVAIVLAWFMFRSDGQNPATSKSSSTGSISSGQGPVATAPAASNKIPSAMVPGVVPSSASSARSILAFSPWGSGPGELGRKRPQEANPEGPMSLASDPSGKILVLDQVNGRIVRLDKDGKPIDTISVPVRAAQDVATASDGSMAVLDRLGDKKIAMLGPDGKVRGMLPLEGKGIPEGGGVTGVFIDGNDIYVEREHGQLVLIGHVDGTPASDRTEIPGRPTRDGRAFVSAFLDEARPTELAYLTVNDRPSMALRFTRKVSLPVSASSIVLLDSDKGSVIYFGVLGAREVAVLCLDGTNGAVLGTTTLPPNDMPEETFRDFAVLDAGGFVYSARDERGVTLMRGDCRSH